MISETRADINIKAWQVYGEDETDKSLGIQVGTPYQIGLQWYKKRDEIERLATDVAAGRRLGGSIYARAAIAKGAFAAKALHTFRVQAPFEGARDIAIADIQRTLNRLVFGSY